MLSLFNNPNVQTVLSNGEYLSYAEYGNYIPFFPSFLKHPIVSWLGDSFKVTNATVGISSKVSAMPHASWDKRIVLIIGIVQHLLSISNTKYGPYIPQALTRDAYKAINLTYSTAKLGLESQTKLAADSLDDKIEGMRLGTITALTAAKMVISTVDFFRNLMTL